MTTSAESQTFTEKQSANQAAATKSLIRGSSLLTVGRMIAIVLNFFVQVITVRCLIKADYGAFEYGLAIASMGSSIAVFGLGRALNRFAPMFHEQRDFGRLAGTIVLSLGCVSGIGVGLVLLVTVAQGFIGSTVVQDPRSMSLLVILIILTPLRALDSIFEELFAALASPKSLFFRRHLLGPLLKLAALGSLLIFGSDARVLSVAFVVGGVLGTTCSAALLWHVLRKDRLLPWFRRSAIQVPARQMFGFSFALLSADLLVIVRSSWVTLVLEFCHGAVGVAAFRAVLPIAGLNTFVAESFRTLFSPVISRMYARGETASIGRVYWRTTAWIAVATFPLFLCCISLADFMTVTLFGKEYADSVGILRLLATGFYVSSVTGFNNDVLKAYGHIGRMFLTDIFTVAIAVILNLWLVPQWGAFGGAWATVSVLLIRPVGNQITIYRLGLLREVDWKCLRLLTVMLAITCVAWLLPPLMGNSVSIQLATTIVGILLTMMAGLPVIEIQATFPELMRFRPVRRILSAKGISA